MKRLLGVLAAAAVLHPAAAADLPGAADLVRIVFPAWQDADGKRVQLVTLPESAEGWGTGGPIRVEVQPKAAVRTSSRSMILVVGLAPTGDGEVFASHALPMGLSAYHFRLEDGRWILAGRQEGFAYEGFFAEALVRPLALSRNVAAVGVESGSCWQGYCGSWMSVYQLGENGVIAKPVAHMALDGYNYNSAGDCRRRLRPLVEVEPGDIHDDDVPGDSHACYKIKGEVSVEPSNGAQPGDLVVRYQGAMSAPAVNSAPPTAVSQSLVLRYENGEYRVISGTNPIPSI
jgi:hypothetical protein